MAVPSKDSDQPVHPHSLTIVFAERFVMNQGSKDSAGLIWVFTGHTCIKVHYMCRNVRKHTLGYVGPVKIQISLCIRAVWTESSLSTFWIAKDRMQSTYMRTTNTLLRLRRLIWVFIRRTCKKVRVLTVRFISLCGSFLSTSALRKRTSLRHWTG